MGVLQLALILVSVVLLERVDPRLMHRGPARRRVGERLLGDDRRAVSFDLDRQRTKLCGRLPHALRLFFDIDQPLLRPRPQVRSPDRDEVGHSLVGALKLREVALARLQVIQRSRARTQQARVHGAQPLRQHGRQRVGIQLLGQLRPTQGEDELNHGVVALALVAKQRLINGLAMRLAGVEALRLAKRSAHGLSGHGHTILVE